MLGDLQTPKSNLTNVLEILSETFSVRRSFLFVYQTEAEKLMPVAVNGLDATEFRRLENKAEKSLFQRSFDENEIVISDMNSEESLNFLQKNNDAETILICLPVNLDNKTLGVFGAEFIVTKDFDVENTKLFLSVVASLLAQNFRIENAISVEKQRLDEENTTLRQELKEKYDFSNIIGNSSPMKSVYDQVAQVARSNTDCSSARRIGNGKRINRAFDSLQFPALEKNRSSK